MITTIHFVDVFLRNACITYTAHKMSCVIAAEYSTLIFYFYFLFSLEDMLIDFGERGREGGEKERNTDVREKHQSVASHMHHQTHKPGMCPDQESNL